MIVSFVAYIASFAVFGVAKELAMLFVAMFLFGIGEAFRTGTHKAMIFTWLRAQGRLDERTRVYGYTRSWSKIGSAVSVVLAAVIVLASFALARLVVSPPAGALKSVVILVDRSASMAARDKGGHTRLDDVRAAVRERLAGLPGGITVSVSVS